MNPRIVRPILAVVVIIVLGVTGFFACRSAENQATAKSKPLFVADARVVGFEVAPATVQVNEQTLENPHATRHLVTLYVIVAGCLVRLDRTIGTWDSEEINGTMIAKYQTASVVVNGQLVTYPVQHYPTPRLIAATLRMSTNLYPCYKEN